MRILDNTRIPGVSVCIINEKYHNHSTKTVQAQSIANDKEQRWQTTSQSAIRRNHQHHHRASGLDSRVSTLFPSEVVCEISNYGGITEPSLHETDPRLVARLPTFCN